jgi:hypothetical protein
MTPLVVTPSPISAEEIANLVLSDGQTDLNLLGTPPWGLYLVELTPPIVPRENTYVLGPEGQRRVRSRPQNAVGNARVRVDRQEDSSATFAADLDALQMMVESAHKRKGTLTFTPPNLEEVTYDIESCQITEAPADGPRMTKRIQEFVIEFECRPYGRLAPETLFTDEVLEGPIAGVEIPAVAGHVPALGELTLTDTSSATSDFVEFGLGQQGYGPDDPLFIEEDDLDLGGDFVGTQPGGAGTEIECQLFFAPLRCCGTGIQDHGGRQKIAALLSTEDSDVWVRFAWRINRGQPSYGRWVACESTVAGVYRELTLAVMDLGDATEWRGWIEAFHGGGDALLYVGQLYIIPAEVCGSVRWSGELDEDHVLWDDQAMRFSDQGAEGQAETGAVFGRLPLDGDTLRIPVSTAASLPSLLVVRRRLRDLDQHGSSGRDADMTATLEITRRVTLY